MCLDFYAPGLRGAKANLILIFFFQKRIFVSNKSFFQKKSFLTKKFYFD